MGVTGTSIKARVRVAGRWQRVADVVVCVADAKIAPSILHAVASIWTLCVHVAGCSCDFKFTEEPKEAWRTVAESGVGTQAPASIPAFTVIGDSLCAVQAHEAFRALAHVSLISVHTGAPILAGVGEAGGRHQVASCLTLRSLKGLHTNTAVVSNQVNARASIQAGVRAAFVHICLTGGPSVSSRTHTYCRAAHCLALATILTQVVLTWRLG